MIEVVNFMENSLKVNDVQVHLQSSSKVYAYMHNTLCLNNIVLLKKKNRTLTDMFRSMLNYCTHIYVDALYLYLCRCMP